MARRDTSNYNTVQNVQPDKSSAINAAFVDAGRQLGEEWVRQGQEAKINENLSAAQLDLTALNNKFQTEYEGDPMNKKGLSDFKMSRQAIFDQYSKDIDPLYRGAWNQKSRELGAQNDMVNEVWGFKQTRVNTVQSLNNSMKNNLNLANIAGQNFAASGGEDISKFLDIDTAVNNLQEYGEKNLGEITATEQLKDHKEDLMKVFVSGAAEADPIVGVKLLDNLTVRDSFSNPEVYMKFKDAIENRALKVQEINAEREVLGALKNQNSVLARSIEKPIPYAELQTLTQNMSLPAQDYFLKANGYKRAGAGGAKLSESEKLETKAEIYDQIVQYSQKEDLNSNDVSAMQDTIFKAMDKGAIKQKDGLNYINQITQPLIEKQEKSLGQYGQDSWFTDAIGFDAVQEYYSDHVEIKPAEGEKKVGVQSSALNTVNKVKLYDYYAGALEGIAGSYRDADHPNGLKIGEVAELGKSQRQKIYREAQTEAQRLFLEDKYPALRTMPDTPNFVYDGGKLIPGVTGQRNITPDVKASDSFVIQRNKVNGLLYRRYSNGKREPIGPATGAAI